MNNQTHEHAPNKLLKKYELLSRQERDFILRMIERRHTIRNTNEEFAKQLTFGQRVADKVASFGGSWTFIIIFLSILIIWILLNSAILSRNNQAFDPYPYILLNLFLSMLAAIQAPIIMMSQNRQAAKDRLDATHDYEVNVRAELEIGQLQEKVDEVYDKQWGELLEMQREQIRLITKLLDGKDAN